VVGITDSVIVPFVKKIPEPFDFAQDKLSEVLMLLKTGIFEGLRITKVEG
jgi:hypothetical protein